MVSSITFMLNHFNEMVIQFSRDVKRDQYESYLMLFTAPNIRHLNEIRTYFLYTEFLIV